MKKFFMYLIAFALIPMVTFAQEREIKEEGKTFFKPHFFTQWQAGAAHTLGEAAFKDLISPVQSPLRHAPWRLRLAR